MLRIFLFIFILGIAQANDLDATARYLAGLPQLNDNSLKTLENTAFWQNYSATFNQQWQEIQTDRFDKMQTWQQEHFSKFYNKDLPLYYPFSGPDFVHAHYLYPDSPFYLFFGLETVGDIEAIEDLTEKQRQSYLNNIHYALRDIYKRSYFITGRMSSDLSSYKINGVIPLFLVFFAKTHNTVLTMQPIAITPQGETTTENINNYKVKGVQFTFKAQDDNKIKTLVYLKVDVSDQGFTQHPEALTYIEKLGKANTFVKSASYLMHYGSFSKIRNVTLAISQSIFQDDTGIPYNYLEDNWNIYLYGDYTKPIKDFSGVYQTDLNKAYNNKTHTVDFLPYSMGYHWWNDNQNHLIAVKK